MPKFKLTSPHYLRDGAGNFVYLEEGTIVGDGETIPYEGTPSLNMDGVDEAGKKAVAARQGRDPIDSIPIKLGGK